MDKKKDFFISYTGVDEHQATWVAGILEKEGYETIIQAWDFNAGEDFILNMDNALKNSKHLIAIFSENYSKSIYCTAEWTAAFSKYSKGETRAVIPIKISDVEPEGLLASITYIDLYKIEEGKREDALIREIKGRKVRNGPDTSGIKRGAMPLNNLPHSRNPYFTGRKEKLELIYNNFQSGDVVSLVQSVSGLGVVGKTSIALEYAYAHSHAYETIWWVNTENSTTTLAAYRDLALKKKIISEDAKVDDIIEAMKYWFNDNDKWLFIYDNADADNFKEWLEPYLPQSRKGHVLITTRSSFFPKSKSVDIIVFNETEAISFLKKRSDKSGDGYSDDLAKMLSERLQHLPLALEQAAAYIVETPGVTYRDYIDLIEQYGIDIFEKKTSKGTDFYIVDYSSIINTTWKISMEKITNKSAVQMFNICAYLAPDRIPVDMFIRGSDVLPKPLQVDIADFLQRNDILRDLTRYSLLTVGRNEETVTGEKRMISMHRLLQEVVQISFNKNYEWLIRSLDICHQLACWDSDNIDSIRAFRTDANHIERIAVLAEKLCSDDDEKLNSVAYIYFNLVGMYAKSFNVETALNYCNKLISMLEKSSDDSDDFGVRFDLLVSYLNRGHIFGLLRAYDKALDDSEISVALGEQLKNENELFDESELAAAYMNRGVMFEYMLMHEKALIDKNKSIDIFARLYRESKLNDENRLANAYMNRGATYASMKMYSESSDDNEKCIRIWNKIKDEGKQIDEGGLAKAYLNISINGTKQIVKKNERQSDKKTQTNIIKGIMASYKKTNK